MKRLDELRAKMRQKAEETDRKYNIRSTLDEVTRTAEQAVRKGADAAKVGYDAARTRAEQLSSDPKLRAQAREAAVAAEGAARAAADTASEAARVATGALKTGARVARDQAVDFFGDAQQYYDAASGAAAPSA
ncbi:MAG TPA: hypothetical protein PLF26_01845, partial [Blastocatellia bacterium]|nr:hypothetical protein [Blastocatellia bacterium]